MAKFFQIVLVVGLIAAGSAEPPRRFNQRLQNRNRFFARQEVAPNAAPAVTPYPPAGEKPEIPFELPNQEAAPFPDQTYGPPDQTYGPPDQTYGPPQTDEVLPGQEDNDEQTTDEPEAERLVFFGRNRNQSSRLALQRGQRAQATAELRRPLVFRKSADLRQPSAFLLPDGTLVYSLRV